MSVITLYQLHVFKTDLSHLYKCIAKVNKGFFIIINFIIYNTLIYKKIKNEFFQIYVFFCTNIIII